MPEQFLNTTKKISKNKIDLKLFYSFYRDYICPYRYTYTLETGEIIEIKFEKNNFPHLLGLHKFKKVAAIDKAEDILTGIFEETITTNILKETDNTVFNVTADRLTYFPTFKQS